MKILFIILGVIAVFILIVMLLVIKTVLNIQEESFKRMMRNKCEFCEYYNACSEKGAKFNCNKFKLRRNSD